jgi:hypothetical protein
MQAIELDLYFQIFRNELENLINSSLMDIDYILWLYSLNLSPKMTFELYIYMPF